MAVLLDGKALAAGLMADLKLRADALKARGKTPGLAVILVGDDPASQVYVRNKGKACEDLGLLSETIRLPQETSQQDLETQIEQLNQDPRIDGILVQLPLPRHLDEAAALRRIAPTASTSKMPAGCSPAKAASSPAPPRGSCTC